MAADRRSTALERLAAGLEAALGVEAVLANEPLARHTALRIGGPADLLAFASSPESLRQSVMLAWEFGIPCRILGAGSNVLVSDAGVPGLIVLNRARAVSFSSPSEQGSRPDSPSVQAEGGASLSTVAQRCVARGLAGLEWAATIPGTVGGAVIGNAGAWGGNVASTLLCAKILETSGEVVDWPVDRFQYAYRDSILKRESLATGRRPVVLKAEFALHLSERAALEAQVAEMAARRKETQPAGASCGSVFRNPPGDYAGRLIEAAGLKGVSRGGAEISLVHANFIVNHGGARAADVKALIELARHQVHAQFGVDLHLEIQLLGRWPTEELDSQASGGGRQPTAAQGPCNSHGTPL